MLKKILKKITKSETGAIVLARLIFWYLYFVNLTSKWQITFLNNNQKDLLLSRGNIFVLWHQQMAMGIFVFKPFYNVKPLASGHSDGRIISNIVKFAGYKIITGSTYYQPTKAIKSLISELKKNTNIVITPDGPRGPAKQINGNIIPIATKTDSSIIPLAIYYSRYKQLKSWDKCHLPLPFGKIKVIFGAPFIATGNHEQDKLTLKAQLDKLI